MHTLLEDVTFHFGRLVFLICQLVNLVKRRDATSCETDACAKAINACCGLFYAALVELVVAVWNDDTLSEKMCVLQKQVMDQEEDLYNRNWVDYTNNVIREAEMAREPDPTCTHPASFQAAAVILQRATRSFLARKKQAKHCACDMQRHFAVHW